MEKRYSGWTFALTLVVVTAAAAVALMSCASTPTTSPAPSDASSQAVGGTPVAASTKVSPTSETEPIARSVRQRLAEVDSWAFAIGDGALDGPPSAVADRLGIFELVVVDGEEATVERVAAIRARGTIVLAYLSVGTIEPWRSWYSGLEPFKLDRWEEWGEYYAEAADPAYRDELCRIAAEVMGRGFDGLFLDNVDMVESHPSQSEGMRMLVSAVSRQTRADGGVVFAQNGDEFALGLAAFLDGWNREDVTFGYDFESGSYTRIPMPEHEAALAGIASMRDAGVLVTTTDYVRAAGSADEAEALGVADDAGALPYVSDIDLGRVPSTPFPSPPRKD